MPTRPLTLLFWSATLVVMGGGLFFTLKSTFFNFDFYEYGLNALTMARLDGEPFGFRLGARTLLPSAVMVPLAWAFYVPGDALAYMRSVGVLSFASLPVLVWAMGRESARRGDAPLVTSALSLCVAANLMMLTSAITSVIDGWAALFLVAGSFHYLRHRGSNPRLALWGAVGFWVLSGQWRINHLTFGAVILGAEWLGARRWRPSFLPCAAGVFALVALFLVPFVLAYGEEALVMAGNSIRENRNIIALLAQEGFKYHQLLPFGIGWPLLGLAVFGAWRFHVTRGWRVENLFVLLYMAHFLFTHLVIIPNQYLRFLCPFILPLWCYWREAFLWLVSRERVGQAALALSCGLALGPVGSLWQYVSDPFFTSGRDFEVSRFMNAGARMIWCGRVYPFHPRDVAWCPSTSFSLYHYANHVLKVHTGRDTFYIRRPPADDGRIPARLPQGWAPYAREGDTLFFNPNTRIFIQAAGIERAASAEVWVLGRRPVDSITLEVGALTIAEASGWLVRPGTNGGCEVRSPSRPEEPWLHLESPMGWPASAGTLQETALVWIRERRAFPLTPPNPSREP